MTNTYTILKNSACLFCFIFLFNGCTSTPEKKIKSILKKRGNKKTEKKTIASFFGKLPDIEDGLTFQKEIRSEWK